MQSNRQHQFLNIFDKKGNMEIGILFTVEFKLTDLKIGIIFAVFKTFRKYKTTSY